MWTRANIIDRIIGDYRPPSKSCGQAFAPSNIALCKYWGKRDAELNLPVTSSLSISLAHLGTTTKIGTSSEQDHIELNGKRLTELDPFFKRLTAFLDLFRPNQTIKFKIETTNNIPTAAGLASSASGFAALVMALDDFFGWNLLPNELSILARMGSGSAARSVAHGFVLWQAGTRSDGMDSFAQPLDVEWPEFRIGIVTLSQSEKPKSSRQAMTETVKTSVLYKSWPEQVKQDLERLFAAIRNKDIQACGEAAEQNSLSMHATMISSWPPTLYWLPETIATLDTVWKMRRNGIPIYLTMDAGPNVKLVFEESKTSIIQEFFPKIEMVEPFASFH